MSNQFSCSVNRSTSSRWNIYATSGSSSFFFYFFFFKAEKYSLCQSIKLNLSSVSLIFFKVTFLSHPLIKKYRRRSEVWCHAYVLRDRPIRWEEKFVGFLSLLQPEEKMKIASMKRKGKRQTSSDLFIKMNLLKFTCLHAVLFCHDQDLGWSGWKIQWSSNMSSQWRKLLLNFL